MNSKRSLGFVDSLKGPLGTRVVERPKTRSRIVKGPNKSIDVEYHGGAALSRSLGRFPITCPDSLLSSFLHVAQLSFTDWIILSNLVIQNLARILLAVVRTAP